jgi:hypothetical protein
VKLQLKDFIVILAISIMVLITQLGTDCMPVPPSGPGAINATLMVYLGSGTTSTKCVSRSVTFNASSSAGSPQTKNSTLNENEDSKCEEYRDIESGQTSQSCYCPARVAFTGLAAGTWTVNAGGKSCSVNVRPGQIAAVTLYDRGRPPCAQ